MAAFFALPLDISLAILGDWIELLGVGCLDSACTRVFRADFLAIIRHPVFQIHVNSADLGMESKEIVQWLNRRSVKVATVELFLSDMEVWVKVDPSLVTTTTALTFMAEDRLVFELAQESFEVTKFHTMLKLLPSLTCFDMSAVHVVEKCSRYMSILASMTALKLKKLGLDCNTSSTKHLAALINSFHDTLEWLSLGSSRVLKGSVLRSILELISTKCLRLTHLEATLCDEDRFGPSVLAVFASDRLPLLTSLVLESDMDMFNSETDADIKDSEVIAICRHHPNLEVLTLPLGMRTSLASCAEALALCPNLMHISTKAYSFEVKLDDEKARSCSFDVKLCAPVAESAIRMIKVLRPFPIRHVHVHHFDVFENSLLSLFEADLVQLELFGYSGQVPISYLKQILETCRSIRMLTCNGTEITDEHLTTIGDHAHNLAELKLICAKDVFSDFGMVGLLERIGSGLKRLDVHSNRQLSRSSLSAIATYCPILTSLRIGNTGISVPDVVQILIRPDALPLLTSLSASDVSNII